MVALSRIGHLAALIGLVLAACDQGRPGGNPAVALEVSPPASAVALGTSTELFALVRHRDGTIRDVSATVTWHTDDQDTAAIAASPGGGCRVTGTAVGIATLTATLAGAGIVGSARVHVTAAVLTALDVTPSVPSIALGTTQQFVASGRFSDGTVQDLTAEVLWEAAVPTVAAIANAPGNAGLATGDSVGTTTITATHPASGIAGATGLTVTAAVLVALAITPASPSIALGTAQQFTATGTYSDATQQDLTAAVTWSSSAPATATIQNGSPNAGRATSIAVGTTAIAALHGSSGLTDSAALTVTPAVLVALAVTPGSPAIALGTTQQFTATGTYSDATQQNLTAAVTWSSSQPGTATISNAASSEGLATSAAAGSTTITALHPGSGLDDATTLTVTPATLVTIALSPADPEVLAGASRQLTATGTYSDSSTQDVTALVTWTSSVPAAATVSNASGTEGLTTGIAAGATTITATDPGSAVFGTTVVTTLTDIELRGATSAGNGAGVTTLTLTTPGATEVDDVLVAVVVVRPASATITPPSGWTLVRRLDQSSPNTNSLAVYHRTATASEPASHAFVFSSSTGTAGGIAAFVGVDPGSPVDVEAGQPTASSLSHTAPSIAPASAGTMLFTAHALASSSAWSPPAGMTEAFEAASGSLGSGGGISLCGNWELLAAAGATGTRTATAATNADVGNAAALALRRAP